jgi:hypothetical protein
VQHVQRIADGGDRRRVVPWQRIRVGSTAIDDRFWAELESTAWRRPGRSLRREAVKADRGYRLPSTGEGATPAEPAAEEAKTEA